jgi:hypothetical protein
VRATMSTTKEMGWQGAHRAGQEWRGGKL